MKKVMVLLITLMASSLLYCADIEGLSRISMGIGVEEDGYLFYKNRSGKYSGLYMRVIEKINEDLGSGLIPVMDPVKKTDLAFSGKGREGWETGEEVFSRKLDYYTYPRISIEGFSFEDSDVVVPKGVSLGGGVRSYFESKDIRAVELDNLSVAIDLLKGGILEGVFLEEAHSVKWGYLRKHKLPVQLEKRVFINSRKGSVDRTALDEYIKTTLTPFIEEVTDEVIEEYYYDKLGFTREETEYLKERSVIRVHLGDGYIPPYLQQSDGEARGYIIDYFERLGVLAGKSIEIVVDEFPAEELEAVRDDEINIMVGPEGKRGERTLAASKRIYSIKLGVLGLRGSEKISAAEDLLDRRFDFYHLGFERVLGYPGGRLIPETRRDEIEDSFEDLLEGKTEYILGDMNIFADIAHKKNKLDVVEISGYIDERASYAIYSRSADGELKGILDKLIDGVGEYDFLSEFKSFEKYYVEKDYTPVYYVLIVFLFIVLLFLRHFDIMKREINQRKAIEAQLIEKVESEKELRETLELIATMGKAVTSSFDLRRVAVDLRGEMTKIFGSYAFALVEREGKGVGFKIVSRDHSDSRILEGAEKVFREREPQEGGGINFEGGRAYFLPLKVGDLIIGVMYLEVEKPLGSLEVMGLEQMGKFLSIALSNANEAAELKKARKKFEKLSMTDDLTGLPNRRSFYEKLLNKWRKAKENREKLGIVIVDLDYFKQVNDTFGHLEGDRVLREVGTVLREFEGGSGNSGFFGRYGGDEFIGGFLGYTSEALIELAAEIQRRGAEILYSSEVGGLNHLGLSIGVYIDDPHNFNALRDFIKKADAAMYQAKSRGRNRVFLLEAEEDS